MSHASRRRLGATHRGGLPLTCALLIVIAGCADDPGSIARESAALGLARVHAEAVDCVDSVLAGDFDADNVPGGATDWTGCFRMNGDGLTAPELIEAGEPIEDGSWLLSSADSESGTTSVAVDVAFASVAQGAAGPVDAVVAWCWAGTFRTGAVELDSVEVVACPDGVIDAIGGSASELDPTAVPTPSGS